MRRAHILRTCTFQDGLKSVLYASRSGIRRCRLKRRELCVASQTSPGMSENVFGIIARAWSAVSSRSECTECRLKFAVSILNSRRKVYLRARVDQFISLIVTRGLFRAHRPCNFLAAAQQLAALHQRTDWTVIDRADIISRHQANASGARAK